jgi:hypothetical protein
LIERCVHGNILKCWPRGIIRRWRQIEYWWLLYQAAVWTKPTAERINIIFTYFCMIFFNISFCFASKSVIYLYLSVFSRRVIPFFCQPHIPHNFRKNIYLHYRKSFQNHHWKIELHEVGKKCG